MQKTILLYVVLLLAQVLIADHLLLGQYAALNIYVLFLFIIPIENSPIPLVTSGFLMGILIDAANGTYGLHAASFTLTTFLSIYILPNYLESQGISNIKRSSDTTRVYELKRSSFLKYSAIIILTHSTVFSILEVLSFDILVLTLKVGLSFLLLFIVSIILFGAASKKRSRRI